MKKWLKRIFLTLLIVAALGAIVILVANYTVKSQSASKIQSSITEIPVEDPPRIAIVFGARVWDDGTLSNSLYDRVITAVELYRAGRVKKLLMSGDNSTPNYDEPTAMKKTAMEMGVPENDIVLDFAGRRTYDTCLRAREIFDVKKAILVSQDYHLPRAAYLCNNLGVDSIGIKANRRSYDGEEYYHWRELVAATSAWCEINIANFSSIKGDKQPIVQ